MNIILRSEDWNTWSILAIDKINKTIESCITPDHLESARSMVNNFIFVTALEEGVAENSLEEITRLLWFKLDLKQQSILRGK